MGDSGSHLADGCQSCRMHQLGFHLCFFGNVLDDDGHRYQFLLLAQYRIEGEIKLAACFGLQMTVDGTGVPSQALHRTARTGAAATVKGGEALLARLRWLAIGKQFRQWAMVVELNVVLGIDQ